MRNFSHYLATVILAAAPVVMGAAEPIPTRTAPRRTGHVFQATAFSAGGTTRSGTDTHMGIVAADNHVLPLGTRIRVTLAGIYSGIYTVRDTGSKVQGRHIDIYIPDRAAAKHFGKKVVRVRVLHWGDGKPVAPAARPAGL
jgi:3D (Asp-Asp-Asp) domain-containing protein